MPIPKRSNWTAGVLFLGLITSLPGVSASVSSAWEGHVNLTISAIGGSPFFVRAFSRYWTGDLFG
jgi:Ca2+/Na+ antiporter